MDGCSQAVRAFMQKQKHVVQRTSRQEAATTAIPDKLYFRIGEVARLCKVQSYVLRFWESEFPQLKPNKSGTGQRLYRRRDVEMALQIKHLLHEEGYTIAGARQLLQFEAREGKKHNQSQPDLPLKTLGKGRNTDKNHQRLQRLRMELNDLLEMLSASQPAGRRERNTRKPSPPNLFGE